MTTSYEPQLQPVAIDELRPTQMTVGFREVANKRLQWRAHASKNGPEFLGRHMVPVVIGPKQRPYLIDNHHLARALQEEGVVHVLTSIVFDLSHLEKREFWTVMDHRRWMYPFDAKGERRSWRDLPKAVADLTDDAYRSLAGAVRRAGGFAKDTTPFSEFMWADFLRTRVDAKRVDEDFERATQDALKLAHGADAKFLPGWSGIAD